MQPIFEQFADRAVALAFRLKASGAATLGKIAVAVDPEVVRREARSPWI